MKISFVLFNIIIIIRNRRYWLLGKILALYLTLLGCQVGKGLKCKRWPTFRMIPKGNIVIGNYVTIGHRITIDVMPSGFLEIGDRVNLTQDILISSNKSIIIGAFTLIAERVSIRDSDHGLSKNEKIFKQESVSKPVLLGADVWVGANSIILKGAIIPDGCVIGANSVVLNSFILEPYCVYTGFPLKMIKKRN